MQGLSIALVIWKNIVDQSWHLSLCHMPQEIQRQMPKLLHSGGESNQWVTWRAKLVPSGEGRELRCKGFPDHMTLQQNGSYSSLDLFSRKKQCVTSPVTSAKTKCWGRWCSQSWALNMERFMVAEGTKTIATKELFANAASLIVCEMGNWWTLQVQVWIPQGP